VCDGDDLAYIFTRLYCTPRLSDVTAGYCFLLFVCRSMAMDMVRRTRLITDRQLHIGSWMRKMWRMVICRTRRRPRVPRRTVTATAS
jgi:hypothetical protein